MAPKRKAANVVVKTTEKGFQAPSEEEPKQISEEKPSQNKEQKTEEIQAPLADAGQRKEEKKKTTGIEKQSKTQEGKQGRRKRGRRKEGGSGDGYKRFVFRVLKHVHPELAISSRAIAVINSLMNDMFERISDEAATLSSREIQDAVRLVLPGELGKHAVAEGAKAVANYMSYEGGQTKS
ncbi:hypothetical protein SLA2020_315430 [Shorea laevis]